MKYVKKKIRTQIYLTDQELEKLRKVANATDISVAEQIRRIIDKYFDK